MNSPTLITDERKASFALDTIRQLETELATVTEQRDTARYYAETFRQNIHDIKPDNLLPLYLPWDSKPEINEYQSVIEQRDRLSEAMQEMWPFIEEDDYPACNTPSFNAAIKKYKESLQSLNPDHTVDANDMIAAVKGGSDES